MSLRIFHMVFIGASIALSIFTVVVALRLFLETRNPGWIAMVLLFAGCGAVLTVYGAKTFRKLRNLA